MKINDHEESDKIEFLTLPGQFPEAANVFTNPDKSMPFNIWKQITSTDRLWARTVHLADKNGDTVDCCSQWELCHNHEAIALAISRSRRVTERRVKERPQP